MNTVHTVAELRAQVSDWRRAGERIGFVPTMGNLHRGHLELVRRAREVSDRVVASIFVNPLQFGPTEDFAKYPRTLAQDQAALAGAGCGLLFAPSVEEMYPRGQKGLTRISVPGISDVLCGHFRPGHFEGVATVVNLLFNQVQPDTALFGEKDFQQLLVIRRMTADLQLPVTVRGVPTEREPDGLALSSRNQYLSPEERAVAPQLHAAICEIAGALKSGHRDFAALHEQAVKRLQAVGFRTQYLEIRTPELADPQPGDAHFVVLAAACLGSTRLIDNVAV